MNYEIEFKINCIFNSIMESYLISVPCNKLVLKKEYIIKTKNGLIYTGTYYYMLGVKDLIHDMLGLGQPIFIDFKPNIENKSLLICSSCDEFYELKVKLD
jgi:hypothetical protein